MNKYKIITIALSVLLVIALILFALFIHQIQSITPKKDATKITQNLIVRSYDSRGYGIETLLEHFDGKKWKIIFHWGDGIPTSKVSETRKRHQMEAEEKQRQLEAGIKEFYKR